MLKLTREQLVYRTELWLRIDENMKDGQTLPLSSFNPNPLITPTVRGHILKMILERFDIANGFEILFTDVDQTAIYRRDLSRTEKTHADNTIFNNGKR